MEFISFTDIPSKGESIMNHQHYLEAVEVVLTWDLPEEALANAINHQVMQSMNSDEYDWDAYPSSSLSFHH
jgi:hypothetical protein